MSKWLRNTYESIDSDIYIFFSDKDLRRSFFSVLQDKMSEKYWHLSEK